MANDVTRALHPCLAGIADALERAIPMPDDVEAKDERRLCRHIDHRQAIR